MFMCLSISQSLPLPVPFFVIHTELTVCVYMCAAG